jgi:hypothetical protein
MVHDAPLDAGPALRRLATATLRNARLLRGLGPIGDPSSNEMVFQVLLPHLRGRFIGRNILAGAGSPSSYQPAY